MTMDLFPLGHAGVAVGQNGDKHERAQRGSVLEPKVRMPTMEDAITASLPCRDPADD